MSVAQGFLTRVVTMNVRARGTSPLRNSFIISITGGARYPEPGSWKAPTSILTRIGAMNRGRPSCSSSSSCSCSSLVLEFSSTLLLSTTRNEHEDEEEHQRVGPTERKNPGSFLPNMFIPSISGTYEKRVSGSWKASTSF